MQFVKMCNLLARNLLIINPQGNTRPDPGFGLVQLQLSVEQRKCHLFRKPYVHLILTLVN